jgi:two-component system, NarL family, nitrate/nitrite response regulator NarL
MKMEHFVAPIRVMLVDDHEHVLWGLTKLIRSEHPRMMVAGTARTITETIHSLRCWQPDVLVIDTHLAGQSSIQYLPDLKKSWEVPVVLLTDSTDPRVHELALARGARTVLMKGESAERLLWEIECAHGDCSTS